MSDADYFMLAHGATALASDPRQLKAYVANLKHALLFTERVSLAEHMVVNAANFRRAFHADASFRQLILSGLVTIVHFDKYIDGPHFTLCQAREFHSFGGTTRPGPSLFDLSLPKEFQTAEFDWELDLIQAEAPQEFPPSADRDPTFMALADAHMERDFLKDLLGEFYASYETAYYAIRRETLDLGAKAIGIIHFEGGNPNSEGCTVFDHMARTPFVSRQGLDRAALVRRFGEDVARAHRALHVNAEVQIMQSRAILPPELDRYKYLVMPLADEARFSFEGDDAVEFEIDLGDLDVNTLYDLSLAQLLELRRHAAEYFHVLREVGQRTVDLAEIEMPLRRYTRAIKDELYLIYGSRRSATPRGRTLVRVARDTAAAKASPIGSVAGVLVQVLGLFSTSHFHLAPTTGPVLKGGADLVANATRSALRGVGAGRAKVDQVKAHLYSPTGQNYLIQYKA